MLVLRIERLPRLAGSSQYKLYLLRIRIHPSARFIATHAALVVLDFFDEPNG
jgi:hypothetical protein